MIMNVGSTIDQNSPSPKHTPRLATFITTIVDIESDYEHYFHLNLV